MSTYLYLIQGKIRDLTGFQSVPKSHEGRSWEEWYIGNVFVQQQSGRCHISHQIENDIPDWLIEAVEEISFREYISTKPSRERGVYKYETARGEVETERPEGKGKELRYAVSISGAKIEHVRELFYRIKAGSIRPEESYEGPQMGVSQLDRIKELEAEVVKLTARYEMEAEGKRQFSNQLADKCRAYRESEELYRRLLIERDALRNVARSIFRAFETSRWYFRRRRELIRNARANLEQLTADR